MLERFDQLLMRRRAITDGFDYNPYDFLPKLPGFTPTSTDITDGGAAAQWLRSAASWAPAGGRLAAAELVGFPRDSQLSRSPSTTRTPDRPGLLALAVANLLATVTDLPSGVGDGSVAGRRADAVQ